MWSQWRCAGCGSLLGIDRTRRLVAIPPFVVISLAVVLFLTRMGFHDLLLIPLLVIFGLPWFLLIDRAVVLERCGFRCRTCGYDLRGQSAPRCPECGQEFNPDERAYLETGVYPRPALRRRRRGLIGVLLIVMLGLLVVGNLVLLNLRSAAPPLATQPATSTSAPATAASP